MLTATTRLELALAKRALYQLPKHAQRLTCRSGSLWITQDNDLRDIVLAPGESFAAAGGRKVIAYALEPATFTVCIERTAPSAARPFWRSPAARGLVLE